MSPCAPLSYALFSATVSYVGCAAIRDYRDDEIKKIIIVAEVITVCTVNDNRHIDRAWGNLF